MRHLAIRSVVASCWLLALGLAGGCSSDEKSDQGSSGRAGDATSAGSDSGGDGSGGVAGTEAAGAEQRGGTESDGGAPPGRGGSQPENGGTEEWGGANPGLGGEPSRGGAEPSTGGAVEDGGAQSSGGSGAGQAGEVTSAGGVAENGGSGSGGMELAGSAGVAVPDGLLDPGSSTVWNPGILSDEPTGEPLGPDNLPVRTEICQTVAPEDAAELQSILDACPRETVVELQSGTYELDSTLYVPSGVVLRGQGSTGDQATVLVLAEGAGGPTLAIGPVDLFDQTCYSNTGYADAIANLLADAEKGQNQLRIAPNNTDFEAGDFALLDELNDDSIVQPGDSDGAFSRNAARVLSQRVEITAVDRTTGTITLDGPLHWTFKTSQQAQLTRADYPVTQWAGIEHVWVQGGQGLGEYLGRKAGGIDVSNAAHCWVKDVQTDGTLTGMHVALTGTYRTVVRDSHFHNSAQYGFGQDNYGIVVRCGASDNLVENNIARYMNKPILFNNSGGGNVVGYNYADNEWSLDSSAGDQFQEASIDIHCTFPHMELVEGNFAPHIAASITHGNAGYLTYFRNYASSQQAPDPIVWSLPSLPQTGNVTSMQFDVGDHHMTAIGNVLGSTTDASLGVPTSLDTADVSQTYMSYDGGSPSIFSLGPQDDISVTTLRVHGNFDTVNGQVMWNAEISTRELPASLYYGSRPAWWPSDQPWPWVGPDLEPMVGTLPAQEISAGFDYDTPNNPECSPNLDNYSCP